MIAISKDFGKSFTFSDFLMTSTISFNADFSSMSLLYFSLKILLAKTDPLPIAYALHSKSMPEGSDSIRCEPVESTPPIKNETPKGLNPAYRVENCILSPNVFDNDHTSIGSSYVILCT